MNLGSLLPKPLGDKAYLWRKWMESKFRRPPEDRVEKLSITLMANGVEFTNVIRTSALKGKGSNLIGFSEGCVLKVEEERWETKRNDLKAEARILEHLTERGCHSAPVFLWEGKTADGLPAIMMDRIIGTGRVSDVDALLAFAELKGAGVIHGDLRPANILWNGQHAVLIDFDQAILDPRVAEMTFLELIEYMDDTYPEHSRYCQSMKDQLDRLHFRDHTVAGKLNLRDVHLMSSGTSTNTTNSIYHALDGNVTFVEGERGLGARKYLLKQIDFANESILDIGCNTGLLVRYLVDRGAKQVDGFELSPEHALLGDIVSHCEGIFNSVIKQGDLSVDEIEKHYDTITLFSVLHHIDKMDDAIAQITAHCNRILIECRLEEIGEYFNPHTQKWEPTNAWSFKTEKELTDYLAKKFGFRFTKNYGKADRKRWILEFRK